MKEKNVARVISWLVGFVIAGVVITFPLGYLFISYQYMAGSLETEAEINANIASEIISSNPEFWEFEQMRLTEYLSHRPRAGHGETRRLKNTKNEVVAESVDEIKPPIVTRSHDLRDSGVIVGKIEIVRSLRPLLKQTGLITLLILPFGFGAFMVLYLLPIRAIYRAEEALKKANDDLETRVRERTNELSKANEELRSEITERKKTEKNLQRANRALRMLIACGRAMMHAEEEAILLSGLCRIIVEVGGYRMAWVGFAGQDTEKTVRPVVQCGHEAEYLEKLNITWADTERGRGPVGTAIRTGTPYIARDIQTDPSFKLWKEEALKHGYRSVIALPLTSDKQTIGALAAYAEEPNAFDSDEAELLMELADDLSYGIKSLRSDAERKQAEGHIKKIAKEWSVTFDSMKDLISVHDKDFKVVRVNKAFADALKMQPEELIGKTCYEVIHKTEEHWPVCPHELAFEDKKQHTTEFFEPGWGAYFEVSASPVLDDKGEITGTVHIMKDITEQKKTEEEIKKKVEELEKFYELAVGRELKMKELKKEIEKLKEELSRYKTTG